MSIMDIPGVSQVLNIGSTLIDRLVPDRTAADKEKAAFAAQITAIDAAQFQAQIDVDKTEAINPNLFISGWRPGCGWVCVLGLTYQFLLYPLLCWLNAWLKLAPTNPPPLDLGTLITLLMGMLGLGGYRTLEKLQGAAGNH